MAKNRSLITYIRQFSADRAGAAPGTLTAMPLRYAAAIVIFGLLAASAVGARDLLVPTVLTGLAGALGAAIIGVAGARPQRAARIGMTAAAVVVVLSGVAFAPDGDERGFVIGVAAFYALLLAAFALVAGPRPVKASARP
ncbi:hypothetical protein Ari01nite_51340 [Paractinoplanes rishiriensis]|uniref:Uncharacterized protein n=2 Tax=Paractinoplanes rishiriensis TaxID=1050105 RepID=A0A919K2K2_9ACTN|nr:hypothetical protein Ari01nite_51340 [Actinoplanes rishiriensis]